MEIFIRTLVYAGFVIAFAQLVRYVAKFLGVEQVEKGFQVAKKAVLTAAGLAAGFVGARALMGITESQLYQKMGKGLATSKIPLLTMVGQNMMTKGPIQRKERVDKYEKEMAAMSKSDAITFSKTNAPSPLDLVAYEKYLALINHMSQKGWTLSDQQKDFIAQHGNDPRFNVKAITNNSPGEFEFDKDNKTIRRIENPTIEGAVERLSKKKVDDLKGVFNGTSFIENTKEYKEAYEKGKKDAEGKGITGEQAKEAGRDAAQTALEHLMTELVNKLTPAQMATLYKEIGEEDLVQNGWGGAKGRFMKAIQSDDTARDKFYDMLRASAALKNLSGITPPKKGTANHGIEEEEEISPKPTPGSFE